MEISHLIYVVIVLAILLFIGAFAVLAKRIALLQRQNDRQQESLSELQEHWHGGQDKSTRRYGKTNR